MDNKCFLICFLFWFIYNFSFLKLFYNIGKFVLDIVYFNINV